MAVQSPQEREHYNQWMKEQANERTSINSTMAGANSSKQEYTDEQLQMDSVNQELEYDAALADQQQQVAARQLRTQKMQKLQSQDQTRVAKAIYTGPPPKKFGTGSFIVAFTLAAVKDAIDFFTLGWVGVLVNIIVLPSLIMIMIMSGSGIKEFLKKRKSALMGIGVLEFIPFLSFIPAWTVAVLWAKIESDLGTKISVKGAAKAAGNMKKTAQMRLLRRMQARKARQERGQQEQQDIEG